MNLNEMMTKKYESMESDPIDSTPLILIGAVTSQGGAALTHETLAAAAEEMRKITIAESKLFKGITDFIPENATILTNLSGVSVGGKWDLAPIKTGGTRADLDGICGKSNERCVVKRDENRNQILDANGKTQLELNAKGQVQFDYEVEGKRIYLADFLDSPAGQDMSGATGGIQGWKGTLFGIPYTAGSLQISSLRPSAAHMT